MDPRDEIDTRSIGARERLLRSTPRLSGRVRAGRKGLFSACERMDGEAGQAWPEAARLRELAVALQPSLPSRKSAMPYAMSSSISAPFTASQSRRAQAGAGVPGAIERAKWRYPTEGGEKPW